MGYIDCDTHVIEPAQTWDYFDPDERQFRPRIDDGYWTVEDHVVQWPGPMMRQWNGPVFPGCDLVDIGARLRYMDDFGVDVQMLYTSWWLLYPAWSPATEAALHRSYNRWVAERTAESGGRLRWAVMAPVRTMERAMEELEFGKEHGAASVFLLGQNHGMSLADPSMVPLYEKAQDLDLRDHRARRERPARRVSRPRQRHAQRADGPRGRVLRRPVGRTHETLPAPALGVRGRQRELGAVRAAGDVPGRRHRRLPELQGLARGRDGSARGRAALRRRADRRQPSRGPRPVGSRPSGVRHRLRAPGHRLGPRRDARHHQPSRHRCRRSRATWSTRTAGACSASTLRSSRRPSRPPSRCRASASPSVCRDREDVVHHGDDDRARQRVGDRRARPRRSRRRHARATSVASPISSRRTANECSRSRSTSPTGPRCSTRWRARTVTSVGSMSS